MAYEKVMGRPHPAIRRKKLNRLALGSTNNEGGANSNLGAFQSFLGCWSLFQPNDKDDDDGDDDKIPGRKAKKALSHATSFHRDNNNHCQSSTEIQGLSSAKGNNFLIYHITKCQRWAHGRMNFELTAIIKFLNSLDTP